MDSAVKEEIPDEYLRATARDPAKERSRSGKGAVVIDLGSSDSDSDDGRPSKKQRAEGSSLPLGFLDPLPPEERIPAAPRAPARVTIRQFWKAGDFDEVAERDSASNSAVGMDHVRVHPKFLHSNATSHKWALGALAELLDNSLDEARNGATYVNIDMLINNKDGTKMLLIEDNGGGMDPDKMRQCMSLGYSAKSKIANTIGQYGNGFKTSTMRLGADVIVFSRSRGKNGRRSTQSIGMLSYTFLRNTGKEDIVVPMLDYEKRDVWCKAPRSSLIDWDANFETIIEWSPYSSEDDLLEQFSSVGDQGTRVVIYNLWEDDQGTLELDFETDKQDIQLRGVSRDQRKIEMAERFPNSKHFLTYRHSLRSYASILYLRLPHVFRMVLRGKVIEHHNLVNDMMFKHEVTYKPQPGGPDSAQRDPNMVAVVTIGFVKDAKDHIDVQGFNVYHKNRLIKPFWRVWNAAGSDGRGVIGVLEANFVEPAHDKQDFERTTIFSRLENKLIQMQKTYWSTNCHKIGYAPRRSKNLIEEGGEHEISPARNLGKNKSTHVSNVGKSKDSSTSQPFANSNGKNEKGDPTSYTRSKETTTATKPVKRFKPFFRRVHDTSDTSNNSDNEVEDVGVESTVHATPSPRSPSLARERFENVPFSTASASLFSDRSKTPASHISGEAARTTVVTRSQSKVNEVEDMHVGPSAHASPGGRLSSPSSSSLFSDKNRTQGSHTSGGVGITPVVTRSQSKVANNNSPVATVIDNRDALATTFQDSVSSIERVKAENRELKERLEKMEAALQDEREKNKSLAEQLEEAKRKLEEANKEQEAFIDIFTEERGRRDKEEESLRKKLKDASRTIQDLLEKRSF